MKIAFLLYSMTGAGEERIASLLAKALQGDYELHLVLINGPVEYELPDGLSITFLRKNSTLRLFRLLSLPWVLFRYHRFCRDQAIDISLSFDNLPNFINCGLRVLGWQGKVWLREVNYSSRRFDPQTVHGWLHRWLIKRLYPKSERVFVNAKRIGEDLVNNFDIPSKLIGLMKNPLDFSLIEQSQQGIAKPPGFTFIHVGAFRPQKNHNLLIEAFALLQEPDVRLWLLGQGPLKQSIKKSVQYLELVDKVVFQDFQANPFQYMAAADCMLLSSDYEGLPNVLLEGLACGLPLIATDCPSGPREIIAPHRQKAELLKGEIEIGDCGILTPVGDKMHLAQAMERMIKDDALRKACRQQAKNRVEEFRIDRIIASFIAEINL